MLVGDGVLDGRPHDAPGALLGHGLDADAGSVWEPNLLCTLGECFCEDRLEFFAILVAVLELDSGINILGVLAENDHVGQFRLLHGTGHALEPAHRAQAGVQVENLAQGDIDRTDAAANRRCKRPLDTDEIFTKRSHGVVWQPFIKFVLGFLSGEHLEPNDLFCAAVGFLHSCVEYELASSPDVRANAVAPNERDDWVIRHLQVAIRDRDFVAFGRGDVFVFHKSVLCSVGTWSSGGEGRTTRAKRLAASRFVRLMKQAPFHKFLAQKRRTRSRSPW